MLACLVAVTILVGRHLRQRTATRLRERFAADLHDHLGASLHAIGILSSHTREVAHSPEKLNQALDEIARMTQRASEATRDFCHQHTARKAHENLLADLRRTAGRMIANLESSFTVEGEDYLQRLSARSRTHFFLFFKESLININRHADASFVHISLSATPREVRLAISDDGRGLHAGEAAPVPPSLARRARYLGSRVRMQTSPSGGTLIALEVKIHRANLFNLIRIEG
ncbi:sensor histidine kinase [Roseibacillus ishigakijimensis]|uniref:Signal transduction histidine kinase subgroup 3 dimerisation and phosphoacceptor domain-containing protein n=1 Tax=Roseibacillus ishigakijimensis TaxID=454146 RepID=A0A934RRZ5_9BACT|nr:histidine kinase [Roseibacillus ishigakijimensis]MBK1834566.1 hypothetical protein [Roseibacillus ishigakijimensis]